MLDLRFPVVATFSVALLLPGTTGAQTCAVERLAAPQGLAENEFGWAMDRDGTRLLVTAAEEFAVDPFTQTSWSHDGGAYVVDILAGGGFAITERLQWNADMNHPELGRSGALEGDFVVLGGDLFSHAGDDLFAFTNGPSGFAVEGRVAIPKPVGVAVSGLDLDIENGRLVVLVDEAAGAVSSTVLHTYVRAGGVWSLTQSLDLGPVAGNTDAGRLALQGNLAYVALETGELRRFVWSGAGWTGGGTTLVAQPGAPFGETLAVDGGRIVGVGTAAGDLVLYSFLEVGGAPLAEVPAVLPATALAPKNLAIEGNRVAIGSPAANGDQGQVELLVRLGSGWQHAETVAPAVDGFKTLFGNAVEFTGDGRLLVGAPLRPNGISVSRGFVEVVEFGSAACASLLLYPSSVSLSGFSTPVEVALVGPPSAAGLTYLLMISGSAATPGIQLDGVFLPLTADAILFWSATQANQTPLTQTLGALDAFGGSGQPRIEAQFLGSGLAGLSVELAWIAVSPLAPPYGTFFASESRTLTFLP